MAFLAGPLLGADGAIEPLDQRLRLDQLQAALDGFAPGSVPQELRADLAALHHNLCELAYQQGEWLAALEHHDGLLAQLPSLAAALPQRRETLWNLYGELLASWSAAVHGPLCAASAEDAAGRTDLADIGRQLANRLEQARRLPVPLPDWLAFTEQQVVQEAGLRWFRRWEEAPQESPEARQHALDLLVRLHALLDPCQEWVVLAIHRLLKAWAEVLQADSVAPEELRRLCHALDRFAEGQEQAPQGLATALLRAGLALDLLDPVPPTAQPKAPPLAPPESNAHALAAEVGCAELVCLADGEEASALQCNIRPLLQADFGAIDQALDDFIWHLPRGSRASPAASSLVMALEPHWRAGMHLPAKSFEGLAHLAAAWQRRLADKLEPPPSLDWQHSLLVELGATELAVLVFLTGSSGALAGALAELRRQHHNSGFWQERPELPWMQCPPPLEALRRFDRDEGFAARGHNPLASLAAWGDQATQALLEAEIWTDDAGSLGLWLRLAQALSAAGRGPLPPLVVPPTQEQLLQQLVGLEVVYVGDRAEAVQAAHRTGRCFRGGPFGLRVLDTPASRWPERPAGGGFEATLAVLLEQVEGLYRQRPFAVLLADCGAYRLPLARTLHQRYGVAAVSSWRPMAAWLAA